MNLSFPVPVLGTRCILIPDFLTSAECAALVATSEHNGYASAASDYPPSYRNNHRHVTDAPALAATLRARLGSLAPSVLAADGRQWHFDGVNERFRFCRYTAGQRFSPHQDGVHHRGPDCRSHLTLLVYLTDGDDIAGGDTVFYADDPAAREQNGRQRELGRVRPRMGSLLLFDHTIWHAGDDVHGGTKHVLRSDVLYRAAPVDSPPADNAAHQGYVWTLARLAGCMLASGGRDAAIRIWDRHGHAVRQLRGHTQSVLGLAPLPGQRLASVSRDRTLRLWNWSTGRCDATIQAHETAVLDVAALADNTLATSGADGLVKLWRQDGSHLATLHGQDSWVWQLAAMRNQRLASAAEDGAVRIWDTASTRCVATLPGDQPLRTLVVAECAIWTGDIAGRIACWHHGRDGWKQITRLQAHAAAVRRLRFFGAGRMASCGEDGALRIWDTHALTSTFDARHANFVTDALLSGDTVISSGYDGRIIRHPPEKVVP